MDVYEVGPKLDLAASHEMAAPGIYIPPNPTPSRSYIELQYPTGAHHHSAIALYNRKISIERIASSVLGVSLKGT